MHTPYTRTGGAATPPPPLTRAERQALRAAETTRRPGGVGDVIERLVKPVARALGLNCLDSSGQLKPDSPSARRRDALNRDTQLSKRDFHRK